jgi:hypothetical protein
MSAQRGPWSGGWVNAPLLLLLLFAVSGCQPVKDQRTGIVKGTVKYRTVAVHGGKITFYSPDGRTASAVITDEGRFEAPDVPVGLVSVAVSTSLPPSPTAKTAPKQKRRFGGSGPLMPEVIQTTPVPLKYSDPAQSGLGLTVSEGEQPYDLDLQ